MVAEKRTRTIGVSEAIAIGIGGMVGGGIFAVLGLAVQLAGGGTPLAFSLAGIVALLTAYSYARLSVTCPSEGGTVSFLVEGFGTGLFSGTLNVLLWVSYIIMLSLYSYAFGSYGATFFPADQQLIWKHVLITAIIIGITILNFFEANIIGKAEDLIVGIKVAILVIFVAVGFLTVNTASFSPATWEAPLALVSGGFIIFVAYEGFELIANTAQDIRDPKRSLPIAYFVSVISVIVLYVLVAMVTVGNLSISQIADARDYALAEAARPFLGQFGFVLIVVAALLSTASAMNATLYGTARFSYLIARFGELPSFLEKKAGKVPIEGLLITTGVTLLLANLLDLRDISTMGSAGFLLIFAAVNWANLRMRARTNAYWPIAALGMGVCLGAVIALIGEALITKPFNVLVLAVMLVISFLVEYFYRRMRKKDLSALRSPSTRAPECIPENTR
jgi:amino acid transporter